MYLPHSTVEGMWKAFHSVHSLAFLFLLNVGLLHSLVRNRYISINIYNVLFMSPVSFSLKVSSVFIIHIYVTNLSLPLMGYF